MKITSQLDYQVILANRARPVYFALNFEASAIGIQPRPKPAAFCLVLDRSGSMEGEPIAKAKQAAVLAVRNLRPEDSFSLVAFAHEAQVLIPFQRATNKADFVRIIDRISCGGNTNLTGGWMLGRDEIKQSSDDASRRLLLLSDGLLNNGIIEPAAVKQVVIAGLEHDHVRTSCLGFGATYNEDLMTTMAQVSGGQFYDADSPEKFPEIFQAELDGLQKLTVQNLRVRLRRLDFCDSILPLGNNPVVERADGWTEHALGDLVSDESRIACFRLEVSPLPWVAGRPVMSLEGERLLEVEIAYDDISEGKITSRLEKRLVRIQATQNPEEVRQQALVIPWVAMQRAGQAIDKVTMLMDGDRMDEAIQLLKENIESLKSYGSEATVGGAIKQLENLLKQLASGDWSLRMRKEMKYRSHSYRKMSSKELWSSGTPPPNFKQYRPPPPPPPAPPQDPPKPPTGGTPPGSQP